LTAKQSLYPSKTRRTKKCMGVDRNPYHVLSTVFVNGRLINIAVTMMVASI
jgi:hypothetical protein